MPAAATAATQVVAGSTRWCPTPEQLMILEEMYRGGLRTPNASQIQQITAHLALYGRIEGKNVFYWFQNHKARDRQKLRRRLCMSHHLLSCAHYYAAATAGHGAHHLAAVAGAGAAAAPPHQYYSSSCGGAGLVDQQAVGGHLLTTTPTPAAGYAASYCYPFAAAPPSRCAAPSPANPLFQYQGGGGLPEYSLGRLGNLGVVEDAPSGYEMAAMADQAMMTMSALAPAPAMGFCRPLKTLDLFPGALKEEQRDVA